MARGPGWDCCGCRLDGPNALLGFDEIKNFLFVS